VVEAGEGVLLDGGAEQPHLRDLGDEVHGELLFAIRVFDDGDDLLIDEVADGLTDRERVLDAEGIYFHVVDAGEGGGHGFPPGFDFYPSYRRVKSEGGMKGRRQKAEGVARRAACSAFTAAAIRKKYNVASAHEHKLKEPGHVRTNHISPEIIGGRACIRGMRITVAVIVGQVAHGASFEEIMEGYPDLERQDVEQAVEYAAWLTQEEIYNV